MKLTETILYEYLPFLIAYALGAWSVYLHYHHREEVREAKEEGKKDERLRKAPPSPYEQMLHHLNALCCNLEVDSYDVKAYGKTFTYRAENENE